MFKELRERMRLNKLYGKKLLKEQPRRMYKHGGGWGNAIQFCDYKKGQMQQHLYGFKHRFPVPGDVLQTPMQSGSTGYWMFTNIEPCRDPRDMFFADVIALGIEDEGITPEILKQVTEFDAQIDDVPAYLIMTRDEYYQKKDDGKLHMIV